MLSVKTCAIAFNTSKVNQLTYLSIIGNATPRQEVSTSYF
jgi:hypothetical protein